MVASRNQESYKVMKKQTSGRSVAVQSITPAVDVDVVDPVAILATIAADDAAPATARVAAARALLGLRPQAPKEPKNETEIIWRGQENVP